MNGSESWGIRCFGEGVVEVNGKDFFVGEGSLLAPVGADDSKCDCGLADRSVGFSLGPGRVASRRTEAKRLSSRPLREPIKQ